MLIYNHENSKEKKEINKIRTLINSDFARFYQLAKEDISKIEQDNVEFTIDNYIDKLTSKKLDIEEFLVKYSRLFEFNFWNAITSSGSLIKLPKEEILLIQATVDTIQKLNNDVKKVEEIARINLRKSILTIGSTDKDHVNDIITDFLGDLIAFHESVISVLEQLRSLKWLDFEKI